MPTGRAVEDRPSENAPSDDGTARDATPLWEPSERSIATANITAYTRWVEEALGREFGDYNSLWQWSVDDPEEFWTSIWDYFPIAASRRFDAIRAGNRMPGTDWFPGALLNYAENILATDDEDAVVVIHSSELRSQAELSYGELRRQVAAFAEGLRELGVRHGDRVAGYVPNIPETLVAFLATASIGAIWTAAAPEFGAESVLDRFAQVEPTVLIVIDGYRYNGKDFDRSDAVTLIREGLPTVRHVVRIPYLAPQSPADDGVLAWADVLERHRDAPLVFDQLPAAHPLWILYSSGTTGLPKAILQSHGGMLVEQVKSGYLHLDLHDDDRIFWFTTTGWMMWNMLIGSLLTGAAVVLYDGSPTAEGPGTCWRVAQDSGATIFGTSAGMLVMSMKAGLEPAAEYDLSAMRAIGSTGSPLPPEGFEWAYAAVKRDLWLFSTSGGTDVCTPFVGGCVVLPVYSGELQCRALGVSVEAWSPEGVSLIDEVGELVVTAPMPSMPLRMWGDDDGSVYLNSYFSVYPGVWRHGDWVRITPRGGAVIYGRSDATINRQGVRMGTSEIYRAVLAVDGVVDALVVDLHNSSGDAWMPLFVVLREGLRLDDDLRAAIARRIRRYCSPRHVPNAIFQVDDLPRTLSNKLLEIPVKRLLMGEDLDTVASSGSMANPASLEFFVALAPSLVERTR